MKRYVGQNTLLVAVTAAVFLILSTAGAWAAIEGISGPTFNLSVSTGEITTPDGGSYLIWGYANGAGLPQYPGPTLIVNEGQTVTIRLTNNLSVVGGGTVPNVSMVFPGQDVSVAETDPGVPGILTSEATPGGTVTYTFRATNPGTYTYYSGTDTALQVEMGLFGAIIVRPSAGAGYAYNHQATQFDREYLFLLSEMDPRIHEVVDGLGPEALVNTDYLSNPFPIIWFINGRAAPDTMSEPNVPWLPHQPYNAFPRMHPGEKVLMRMVGAGRDLHPFHHHGNHARVIARDGRLLSSSPIGGPDLSYQVFTITTEPGATVDAIFEWTGEGLNWDIYGTPANGMPAHNCIDGNGDGYADAGSDYPMEWCADHNKPFPVTLPNTSDLFFGGFYSGSPFLGTLSSLPPGEGGLNPYGGFSFMWHSHTEKELTNADIFPGGLMTMLIIEAPGVPIP